MRILDCEQGSEEWHAARLGIPTASEFDKIITPGGKPSKQAEAIAFRLAAETFSGERECIKETDAMRRGIDLEPVARAAYSFVSGFEVELVGFVTNTAGTWGASPDGLVEKRKGGLELKCPLAHTHAEYLYNATLPAKYKPQVQGQILICCLEYVDFMSYHPAMPPLLVRVERDEAFVNALEGELARLHETKQAILERLEKAA